MFKVLGVDHIGIASTDLADGEFWKALGLKCTGEETVAEQKVTTAFYPTTDDKEHGEIELLVASEAGSPIEKFIEKNGGRGGIQHIALRVDDLEAALADLKEKGIKLIDEKPRKGAGGAQIAFIHPKATHGVLLELCQRD